MGSPTRIDYGNSLLDTVRQPTGSYHIDAYGLAQAQLTFAIDTDTLYDTMDAIKGGIAYQDHALMSFEMKSYKYSAQLGKGSVSMITVDYMGIARQEGYTDTQIVGVSTTTAQPIETHPNFTIKLDSTIGNQSPTQILAGPPSLNSTNPNNPLWIQDTTQNSGQTLWKFNGFGLTNKTGEPKVNVNPKAGVRQYLKPMLNVRGTIFFKEATGAGILSQSVGKTILESSKERLLGSNPVLGAQLAEACLLTSANIEIIGTPSNPAGYKVTYDIMITDAKDANGNTVGWDKDIYGPAPQSPF
jgi:hypothetical protein